MGHTVIFRDLDRDFPLSQSEITEIIDLFYRWDDTTFFIGSDVQNPRARGEHTSDWTGSHHISLSSRLIRRSFDKKEAIGGTHPAPTLKTAAAFTLVHELQHANQTKFHKGEKGFYGIKNGLTETGRRRMKQYWGRACEREARDFVDDHMNEICAFFSVVPPRPRRLREDGVGQDEVMSVADLLCECEEVTMDDIREELRLSKALTPTNFKKVSEELTSRGVKIKIK